MQINHNTDVGNNVTYYFNLIITDYEDIYLGLPHALFIACLDSVRFKRGLGGFNLVYTIILEKYINVN